MKVNFFTGTFLWISTRTQHFVYTNKNVAKTNALGHSLFKRKRNTVTLTRKIGFITSNLKCLESKNPSLHVIIHDMWLHQP